MKRNVVLLTLLLICSFILITVAAVFDRNSRPDAAPPSSDTVPYIEISMDEGEIPLVGVVVEEWMTGETGAAELYKQYKSHIYPYTERPVVIQWGVFDIPDASFIRKQYFELAIGNDFQNAVRYDLRSGERSIELTKLLVDTDYSFRITLELESKQDCVVEAGFKTKWSPRILEFENLRNIRDIGGWKTTDGLSINQKLLYRGCELDGATQKQYQITSFGVDTMVKELNVKTELDLRDSELEGTKDALGSGVEHRYFGLPSYAGSFTVAGNEKMREVFSALAVKGNYPVYLHCGDGKDRTGMVCYLLEALLGVSEEDCKREWELSALAIGNGNTEGMSRFVENLNKVEGVTLKEKAEAYLLSIGVTQEQIDSIRSIFLG
jgi:protein tyrosine/serine phosphatase